MKKTLVFGTGEVAQKRLSWGMSLLRQYGYEIVGFLDNDVLKQGTTFFDLPVYGPQQLKVLQYDMILIACGEELYPAIYQQLLVDFGIIAQKIHAYTWFLQQEMQRKYKDIADNEIQDTLKYLQDHELSVFNQFVREEDAPCNEVFYDSTVDLPYIFFETVEGKKRRMYYPKNYKFDRADGKAVVKFILREQSPGSPHLYQKPGHQVDNGDVVLDVGVCEGNFSLRYVDIASSLYLFEMDDAWQKPLFYTFKDYQNKVHLYHRAVSDRSEGIFVRLDDVVQENVDFLKMDIEGAEIAGLQGAEKLLRRGNTKCSICSYHQHGDEFKIEELLKEYQYKVSVSAGYMVFLYGMDTWQYHDFRRGIVYGKRA